MLKRKCGRRPNSLTVFSRYCFSSFWLPYLWRPVVAVEGEAVEVATATSTSAPG